MGKFWIGIGQDGGYAIAVGIVNKFQIDIIDDTYVVTRVKLTPYKYFGLTM